MKRIGADLENLVFDEDKHIYRYNGKRVPCVSDVLKIIDVVALDGIPLRYLLTAGERGKRVHEITEDLEYGLVDILDEDWQYENADIVNYVYGYVNFLQENKEFPLAMEQKLYCEEIGIAGTLDLVKEIDGNLAIVDKKTSGVIGWLRSTIQLNFYRILWNNNFSQKVDKLYILHLEKTGEHRLIPIEINEELVEKYLAIYREIKGDKKL